MGFFSKIKEAILGESVEHDNLNEDMDLNEAEALDEDFDALDEEMGYVDEGLASDRATGSGKTRHDDEAYDNVNKLNSGGMAKHGYHDRYKAHHTVITGSHDQSEKIDIDKSNNTRV